VAACEEVKLHLGYRWFCRLELDDKLPDAANRWPKFAALLASRYVLDRATNENGIAWRLYLRRASPAEIGSDARMFVTVRSKPIALASRGDTPTRSCRERFPSC
jgi:hypothetical protein